MEPNAIILLAGILFLVIAVVGGGFTLERVQVPTVPKWSRIASGALGAVFVGGFFFAALSDEDPEATPATGASEVPTTSPTPASDAPIEPGGSVEIYNLSEPATGGDIELTEFRVLAPADPPTEGDTITVEFDLRNATQQPITFKDTFVAVRFVDDENLNLDTGQANQGKQLGDGDTLPVTVEISVYQAGEWMLWPCYDLEDGSTCPDEWNALPFHVEG